MANDPDLHLEQEQEKDLIGSYFLELWRSKSKIATVKMANSDDEQQEEAVPTELDTVNSSGGFSIVLPDKLSIQYPGISLHSYDVGAVQANCPAPVKRMVYYFEIFVKNGGAKGFIAIGFTTQGFNLRRQPGWEENSFGYHGDDGHLYHGGKRNAFGPTFSAGDTVGAGINYASNTLFFTKNGKIVGTTEKDVKDRLYPTVALHSHNEELTVNFGKDPFVFDIKAYEAREREKRHSLIKSISIPQTDSYRIVRSYLQHYGYEETLDAFDAASQSQTSDPPVPFHNHGAFDVYALNHRKILRNLIREGEIDAAFDKLQEWYPRTVEDDTSAMCFMLHCQKFIELVRAGQLEEAVEYARTRLEKFHNLEHCQDLVKDCGALLAYEDPKKSLVGYLLEEWQRENVADAVNAIILSTNPEVEDRWRCLHSYLERLLRQLSVCLFEKRVLNGNEGEVFHLRSLLLAKNPLHIL